VEEVDTKVEHAADGGPGDFMQEVAERRSAETDGAGPWGQKSNIKYLSYLKY
jgi:hypothetical protein